MATTVDIRGLSDRGFRILASDATQKVVKRGTSVTVDIDNAKVANELIRHNDDFIRASTGVVTVRGLVGDVAFPAFRTNTEFVEIGTGNAGVRYIPDDPTNTDIRVRHVNPGTASAPLGVTASTHDITVSLATNAGTKATAVLSSDGTVPSNGDTVVVNDKTYRFEGTLAQANDVKIAAADSDTTLDNLVKAVNGTGVAGTNYFAGTTQPTGVVAGNRAGTGATGTVTFTASTAGVAANSFPKSETSTHLSYDAGTTFSGGVDPVVTSTAAQVATAVNTDPDSDGLIEADLTGDGSGLALVSDYVTVNVSGQQGIEPGQSATIDVDSSQAALRLRRNKNRYIVGSTNLISIKGLAHRGIRIKDSGGTWQLLKRAGSAVTVNVDDRATANILSRNVSSWIEA